MVAGAIDDGFLVGIVVALGEQALEQMRAHFRRALHEDKIAVEARAFGAFGDGVRCDRLAGEGVGELLAFHVGAQHAAHAFGFNSAIVKHIPLLDLGRCQVAVGDALQIGIFIDRLAKVFEIVGQLAAVVLNLLPGQLVIGLRQFDLARCGGEADVYAVLVRP